MNELKGRFEKEAWARMCLYADRAGKENGMEAAVYMTWRSVRRLIRR
jgi:hypothetical protein